MGTMGRVVLGGLVVMIGAGVVLVRRPETSSILRRVALGSYAYAPVIDTRTGRTFIGGYDGRVYMLATGSGRLLRVVRVTGPWSEVMRVDERTGRVAVAGWLSSPSLVPASGSALVGVGVHLLDATDSSTRGTILIPQPRRQSMPSPWLAGPWIAADARSGHLFVFGNARPPMQLSTIDFGSGRLLHAVNIGTAPAMGSIVGGSPLAVDTRDERVFVSHLESNRLSILDATTGRLVRTMALNPASHFLRAAVTPANSVTVDEGRRRVFVGDPIGGTVATLDARSGRILRSVYVGPMWTAPVVGAPLGRGVVLRPGPRHVLDAGSGRILHAVSTAVRAPFDPIIDAKGGRVVVADRAGGTVEIFDGVSGAPRGDISLDGTVSSVAVDERMGHVFILSTGPLGKDSTPMGRGRFTVLDGVRGSVLRGFPIDASYGDIVVDAVARRVVVVGQGGLVRPATTGWEQLPSWARRLLPWLLQAHSAPGVQTLPASAIVLDATRL